MTASECGVSQRRGKGGQTLDRDLKQRGVGLQDILVEQVVTVNNRMPDTETYQAEDRLTLTGWSAVAGAAALTAVVLAAIVMSWKRFFDARNQNYQLVSKMQRPSEVEMP